MNTPLKTPMRKLILTGTYAQYRDWLALHKAHPRAAVFISRGEQFRGMDPAENEVVLGDCYRDNKAYMSPDHVYFMNEKQALSLAS